MNTLDFRTKQSFLATYNKTTLNERKKLYKNSEFKNLVFSSDKENKLIVKIVLYKLEKEDFKTFFTDDIIDSIINYDFDKNMEYILYYLPETDFKYQFLNNEKIFSALRSSEVINEHAKKINYSFIEKIFNYDINKLEYHDLKEHLKKLPIQRENWIEKSENYDKLINFFSLIRSKDILDIVSTFDKNHSNLCSSDVVRKAFKSSFNKDILDFFSKEKTFNDDLLNDRYIINALTKYSKDNNAHNFRRLMQKLYEYDNSAIAINELEKKRKEEIISIIENEDLVTTNQELKNLICDYIFEDQHDNVLENVNVVLEFASEDDKWFNIIGKENIVLFKEFMEAMAFPSRESLLLFFSKIKDKQLIYMNKLAEFMEVAREISNKEMSNDITKISSLLEDSKIKKEKIGKITVINLEGEDFKFLIHKSVIENLKKANPNEPMTSISLISDKNIESEYYLPNSNVYGFDKVDPKHILHVCVADSFSSITKVNNKNKILIWKAPNYIKTDTLIKNTRGGYNEIVLLNRDEHKKNFKVNKPSFLIVYDEITEKDIKIALINNIPIVKINKEKYIQKDIYLEGEHAKK